MAILAMLLLAAAAAALGLTFFDILRRRPRGIRRAMTCSCGCSRWWRLQNYGTSSKLRCYSCGHIRLVNDLVYRSVRLPAPPRQNH